MALLEIKDLRVRYCAQDEDMLAADGVSLDIEEGEFVGLVGESGCGKSTLAKAILGILPRNGRVSRGSILYRGGNLLDLPEAGLRRLRGREIALVPQNAMNAFDPVYTVGHQIEEAIAAHEDWPASARRARVIELFALVGLPESRIGNYPHQFSGGMRQRAMIAMALALEPKLIVADEPTTGLDVAVQDQIMDRIHKIRSLTGHAMLLITHDMALVSENCSRVAVMYAGRIVEQGGKGVFAAPLHPYTMGLVNAFPDAAKRERELVSIPGSPPRHLGAQPGCPFRPRCPFATALCGQETPPLAEAEPGHLVACHYTSEAAQFRRLAAKPETWRSAAGT